jgi:hypothetical protein
MLVEGPAQTGVQVPPPKLKHGTSQHLRYETASAFQKTLMTDNQSIIDHSTYFPGNISRSFGLVKRLELTERLVNYSLL